MRYKVILFFIVFFTLFSNNVLADNSNGDCQQINSREIIVQTASIETARDLEKMLTRIEKLSLLEDENIYVYKVPVQYNYEAVLESLKDRSDIIRADPNGVRCLTDIAQEPLFSQQTYLKTVNLPKSMEITEGSEEVIVAVLDSGVDRNHPELEGRLLPGIDFVNGDSDPSDDNGHGTHVTGILAANIDGTGIAGVTQNVKILPVKVADENGLLYHSDIIKGIDYAIKQGADIINMSFSGSLENEYEKIIIEEGYKRGITLIAATGNDGLNKLTYPSSYPNVISVAATSHTASGFSPARFSNYNEMVDIAAPGTEIVTTGLNGKYVKGEGTSFSAPIISGLAALIKSVNPTWKPAMIQWAIEQGAMNGRFSKGYWNEKIGYGVVDFYQSLILPERNMGDDIADDRRQAFELKLHERLINKIHLPNDVDWYTFHLPRKTEIRITLASGDTAINVTGDLYRQGDKLKLLQLTKRVNVIELEAGTYELKIFEPSGHWSNHTYELIIESEEGNVLYQDVPSSSSHFEAIQYLTEIGAINGYTTTDGTKEYRPNHPLTRMHAAKLFAQALPLPNSKNITETLKDFTDVSNSHYYANEIAAVIEKGIFTGDSNRMFHPESKLTRAQMATVIVRAFNLGDNGKKVDIHLSNVPGTHRENVKILKQHGITTVVEFRPTEPVTRGQFASFLFRAMTVKKAE